MVGTSKDACASGVGEVGFLSGENLSEEAELYNTANRSIQTLIRKVCFSSH